MRENILYEKSFKFSIDIISLYKYITETKNEYIISKQILRSGTSIGANVKEGIVAQSKKDFLAKMYISLKEASETEYWLELLKESKYINDEMFYPIFNNCKEINRILYATVRTTKEKLQHK